MTILLISDLDMLCWLFFLYFSSTAARANWLMPALLITGLFAYLVAVDLEHYIPFYRIYRYILIKDLMPDDVEALFRVNGLYTFALAFPQPDGTNPDEHGPDTTGETQTHTRTPIIRCCLLLCAVIYSCISVLVDIVGISTREYSWISGVWFLCNDILLALVLVDIVGELRGTSLQLVDKQEIKQILGVSGELQDVSHEQALASEVNLADLGRREAFTLMEVQDVNNKQSVNDELKLADQGRREALKLQWFAHCELLRKQRSHECCRS